MGVMVYKEKFVDILVVLSNVPLNYLFPTNELFSLKNTGYSFDRLDILYDFG